ncbi:sigma-K factor [Mycobacterium phage Tiger]|uniref:DNA binding protein n=3 Tax=Benedictvirus TaxID=2946819 RepID=H9NCW0_9CAUD|nr:sigma-K factor [Mycobacterium phage Conspiracy]YP_008859072.1 sigma-K factor [Mycobacterium phage Jovo]YP_009607689.1 sigma-K factor [Mycobacterium phage Tiger]YP_010061009.1 sigma-K factor [Mycobacterium phage Archetta]ATW60019.1 DNA binding protein [Mycobacterium phage Phlorence]ATW60992.1 DNA binding protein [Mycobacterium phage Aragog]ATW61234.1 DNA binding protein [Mycobacterium phage AgentM]QGJ97245.1 DNA binding protein [Mycobacterium phage Lev2]WNM67861.1 DNA binding protein [Myc
MTTDKEVLGPVIRRAAKAVAFQWPGIVEQEDVEQEIWAHLLARESTLEKVSEMESRAQYRAIVGIGHQIASQERTDYDHYKGSYTYSVADVKSLLKRGVLTTSVDGFDAAVVDLMEGLEKLVVKTPQYVEAIVSRYADEVVPKSNADELRLRHATEALTKAMNQSARVQFATRDDGPGTRGQVSTEDHYEGNDFDFDSFANHQGIGWG